MNRKIKNTLLVIFGLTILKSSTIAQLMISQNNEITTTAAAAKLLIPWNAQTSGFTTIYSSVLNWTPANMVVKDMAITSDKSMWIINANGEVVRFLNNTWYNMNLSSAARIAAEGNMAWALTTNGEVHKYDVGTNRWIKMPGIAATDIAIGKGVAWVIGKYGEPQWWDGSIWHTVDGSFTRIAVDKSGDAWVVNSAGKAFNYKNYTYTQLPVSSVKDIAIAGDSIWLLGSDGKVSRWADSKQTSAGGANFQQLICDYSGTPWGIDGNQRVLQGVRQKIGVNAEIEKGDGMISFADLEPAAVTSKAITITQSGGYSAWITLTYVGTDGLTKVAMDQKGIPVGWRKTFNLAGNETNFKLTIKEATGLAWEPWKTVYNASWPAAKDVCIKVYGTTLAPKWNSECK